jgi:hypothetical protein
MSQINEIQQSQQDQPDSSSEIPMFTMIPPDGQSTSRTLENDSNNNNNDRNNNTGKSKDKIEDDGKKILQRYSLDVESPHHAVHHPHHLLLLQQQQQMNQQMSMDKGLIPQPENSPSLIVLQPSAQSAAGYSSFFNHYATGK